jgi:hypothetical protein
MAKEISKEAYKDLVRAAMEPKRLEIINQHRSWILKNEPKILNYLVDGEEISPEHVSPHLEVCTTQLQNDIWRYCRYTGAMPYSDYVGRRMRFLIRDYSLPSHPIMGIAAIGSSVMQVRDRDNWIGWNEDNREIKKKRIANMMDLYVSISIPPYNELLTGKLICYMMVSNEVREIYRKKYEGKKTIMKEREVTDMVLLATTTLYGLHCSQYNRLKYTDENYKDLLLYIPVGETAGFGSMHVTDAKFNRMRKYLQKKGINLSYRFGNGANWRLRVIREYYDQRGWDSEKGLNHGYKRGVYVAPLAKNCKEFLRGETDDIDYYDFPNDSMINYWKERWLIPRIEKAEPMARLFSFKKNSIKISALIDC